MQLTCVSVLLALALVSSAAPVARRGDSDIQDLFFTTEAASIAPVARRAESGNQDLSKTAGALYFMTNNGEGNQIVAATIGANGQLSLGSAVSTGGNGARVKGIVGADALGAQGALKVSSANSLIAGVNAGSNTISLFSIDAEDPTKLTAVGKPVDSQGEFPVAVAFNSKGTQLCALNGGQNNNVACFAVDATKGLTANSQTVRKLGLNQTTPPTGPTGTVSNLIFSEDDSQLIASVKGSPPQGNSPPVPGFIAAFNVSATGDLSDDSQKLTAGPKTVAPFGMTIIPGQKALIVADPAGGFDVLDLADQSKTGKSSNNVINNQTLSARASHSQQSGSFFVTDPLQNIISEISLDKNLKATVVNTYGQGNNSGPTDTEIATIAGKDFMYVLDTQTASITVFDVSTAGDAKGKQIFEMSQIAKEANLTMNGDVQGLASFVSK